MTHPCFFVYTRSHIFTLRSSEVVSSFMFVASYATEFTALVPPRRTSVHTQHEGMKMHPYPDASICLLKTEAVD